MRKIILSSIIAAVFLTGFCLRGARCDEFKVFQGRINASDVNVRSDSTVSSGIVVALSKGDVVTVVGQLYDWYKIRLPKNAPAYIFKELTESLDDKTAVVIVDNVNIRLAPSETAPVVGKAQKDEVLAFISEQGQWLKIKPVRDSFGWVHKMFVEPESGKIISPGKKFRADDESAPALKKPDLTLEKGELSLEGVIRPYGRAIGRPATHKLVCLNQHIFLLKGDIETLNALNYRRARVTGKIIEEKPAKYPLIEIHRLEVAE